MARKTYSDDAGVPPPEYRGNNVSHGEFDQLPACPKSDDHDSRPTKPKREWWQPGYCAALVSVVVTFNMLNVLLFFDMWYIGAWFVAPIVFGSGAAVLGGILLNSTGRESWLFAVSLGAVGGGLGPHMCLYRAVWSDVLPWLIGMAAGAFVHWAVLSRNKQSREDLSRNRKRRFQFNLKMLLGLLALFGTGFAWLVMPLHYASRNSRAIAVILKLRGRPVYDVDSQPAYDGHIRKPVWLRHLGDEYFGRVIGVNCADRGVGDYRVSKITDNDLVRLRDLNQLMEFRVLRLGLNNGNRRITDAGLVFIGELSRLEDLSLNHTGVTGPGLVHLKTLTNLNFLSLAGTQVTDGELEHLQELKKLERLHLEGTAVTDAGVKRLQQALPNCVIYH